MDRKQALEVWFDVIAETVREDGPDLSARQLAVLMTVYMSSAPHTVRALAKQLKLGKPAVTRAVDALSKLGLLKRAKDPQDGRNVFIQRTVRGSVFLSDMGDTIVRASNAATVAEHRDAA